MGKARIAALLQGRMPALEQCPTKCHEMAFNHTLEISVFEKHQTKIISRCIQFSIMKGLFNLAIPGVLLGVFSPNNTLAQVEL
jgi:hypothetical protein